jgi:hypothetical protein
MPTYAQDLTFLDIKCPSNKYTRKFLPIVLCVLCGRHLIFVRSSPSKKEGIHSYMYVWDPIHDSKKSMCVRTLPFLQLMIYKWEGFHTYF